jgi:hypothetical protein
MASAWATLPQRHWFKTLVKYGSLAVGGLGLFESLSNLPETIAKDKTFFRILEHALLQVVRLPIEFIVLLAMVAIAVFLSCAVISMILDVVRIELWDKLPSIVIWLSITITVYLPIRYGFAGTFDSIKQYGYRFEDAADHKPSGFHKCLEERLDKEICYDPLYYEKQ